MRYNMSNKRLNEFHHPEHKSFDMSSWEDTGSSCGCGDMGTGPEMFSDAIRTMPVSELLNQLKGTDEGLYRKLVYYIRDTYHEDNKPVSEPSFDNPISIEDVIAPSSCGMGSPVKSISIIRKESNQKGPDLDLMLEAWKAKKMMKSKKMSKKSKM